MGFLVVALKDSEADVRSFLEEEGYDLPIMLDPMGSVAGEYGVSAVPTAVFVDADGRVAGTKVGTVTKEELEANVAAIR